MTRGNPLLGARAADSRPRIYLAEHDRGVSWRLSPNGLGTPSLSIAAAITNALAAVDHRAAVILWEPKNG